MLVKSKWDNLKIIGKDYTLELLEELSKTQSRYTDLRVVCSNDKTLTKRLRELESHKLIETTNQKLKPKGRSFVFYKLTKRGENIILRLKELL